MLRKSSRAERRADTAKTRAKRKRLCKNVFDYEPTDKALGLLANTAKPCSCWMCRNRRRDEGPPIKELRLIERERDEY